MPRSGRGRPSPSSFTWVEVWLVRANFLKFLLIPLLSACAEEEPEANVPPDACELLHYVGKHSLGRHLGPSKAAVESGCATSSTMFVYAAGELNMAQMAWNAGRTSDDLPYLMPFVEPMFDAFNAQDLCLREGPAALDAHRAAVRADVEEKLEPYREACRERGLGW